MFRFLEIFSVRELGSQVSKVLNLSCLFTETMRILPPHISLHERWHAHRLSRRAL